MVIDVSWMSTNADVYQYKAMFGSWALYYLYSYERHILTGQANEQVFHCVNQSFSYEMLVMKRKSSFYGELDYDITRRL
jgi:hypothetical protein